jgi:RNase P subunit RPR2
MDDTTRQEWRCWKCDTLLGVEEGGELHLKYKEAQYHVRGAVKATCRRCGSECSYDVASRGAAQGREKVAERQS